MGYKHTRVLLCGIGKLENNYIREWVEYHKTLGFDNIVLYDNNDKDGEHFEEVIGDYIDSGYVILKDWRGRKLAQIPSYNECYKEYNNQYDWVAFWDIDEFIEFDSAKTIQEFLDDSKFTKAKCIRVGWKQYTDGDKLGVDPGGNYSITRFTEVFDEKYCIKHHLSLRDFILSSTQAKSIIRSGVKNFKVTSPHCFLEVPTVNAIGGPAKKAIQLGNTPVWKGAWLNHYRFKTIEEYVTKKMVRLWPTAYLNGGKDGLNLDFFFRFNKKTTEKMTLAKELMNEKNKKDNIKVVSWVEMKSDGTPSDRNWGDDINFLFLKHLFNKNVVHCKKCKETNYAMIGSILNNQFVNNETIVWGSGIQMPRNVLLHKPKKICAVRGPLTRKFLLSVGVDCPEIYGDPSLLIPYYYYPIIEKKYEIGFIPHHSSLDSPAVKEFCKNPGVRLIKTKGYKNWKTFIDEILSCKYIVSESLHGIIMAEAYGIPNLWVDITLNHCYDIKFHDFFLSLGCDRQKPIKLTRKTNVDEVLRELSNYKQGILPDLKLLAEACPIEIDKKILERINSGKYPKEDKKNENKTQEVTQKFKTPQQKVTISQTLKEKLQNKRLTTMDSVMWKTFND